MKLTRNSSGIRKVLFLLFYQTKAQFELTNEPLQGSWQKWSAGEARGQKPRHAQWAGWALEKEQGVGEGHLQSEVAGKWPGLEPPPALRGRGPGELRSSRRLGSVPGSSHRSVGGRGDQATPLLFARWPRRM